MNALWPLVWTGASFAAATLAALTLRRVALAALPRWTQRSALLTAGAAAIEGPSLWWCGVLGLYVANEVAQEFSLLPARWHGHLRLLLEVGVILSLTVTLAGLAGRLTGRAVEQRALGGAVTGLSQTTARAAVFMVGLLVLLSALGIHITPILAALGVGGLAVALALQDTLTNLFAGIQLLADRLIRVGDYVKVGDNVEGFVLDVGWRSTRIRSLANNVIVVPNQTVARATITNYDLPEPRLGLGLKVSVDYSADPDQVEKLLLDEVNRAAGQVPGLLPDPAPSVSLIPGFGEYSLDFTVGYHVERFVDQYHVQHELRKRILQRLHREGIVIPVPVRAVTGVHETAVGPRR
ncbi:MAG TPA: mechanosensitive ion channel family protein [Methylomirabilota bacterium]|nr:mechanosensitive ion channel family protein [Methylomirabilota bacterium]